jgi:hypothetical protein
MEVNLDVEEEDDVRAERMAVWKGEERKKDIIKIWDIRKDFWSLFGKTNRAVDDVTVGIKEGEVMKGACLIKYYSLLK